MLLSEAVRFAYTSVSLCHSIRRYFLAQSPPLEPENLIVNLISYSESFLVFITIAPSNWCSIHIDNCRSSSYTYKITFSFLFRFIPKKLLEDGVVYFLFCCSLPWGNCLVKTTVLLCVLVFFLSLSLNCWVTTSSFCPFCYYECSVVVRDHTDSVEWFDCCGQWTSDYMEWSGRDMICVTVLECTWRDWGEPPNVHDSRCPGRILTGCLQNKGSNPLYLSRLVRQLFRN
jgi:hypothetical protein